MTKKCCLIVKKVFAGSKSDSKIILNSLENLSYKVNVLSKVTDQSINKLCVRPTQIL